MACCAWCCEYGEGRLGCGGGAELVGTFSRSPVPGRAGVPVPGREGVPVPGSEGSCDGGGGLRRFGGSNTFPCAFSR